MVDVKRSARIEKLGEYYLTNSKMSIDKNTVCWKCHRSLMLYVDKDVPYDYYTDEVEIYGKKAG